MNVYEKALDKFGIDCQLSMMTGEMGELAAAITQHFTQGKVPLEAVVTELADVAIMVEQITIYCNEQLGGNPVEHEIARKLNRLEKMVDGDD